MGNNQISPFGRKDKVRREMMVEADYEKVMSV
jgi:hypothetical protein